MNKVPYPDYQPRSYRELSSLLGRADSGLEWIEVAIRHLFSECETNDEAKIDELAKTYNIRVNKFNKISIKRQWACLQIVSVCQYVEWFLDEFREEFLCEFPKKNKGEDNLRYTLRIRSVAEKTAGHLEVHILDYYRLIRNTFLHAPEVSESKRLSKIREEIISHFPTSPYSNLMAPNSAENLHFDDFVLFTRALKNFSRQLCQHAKPNTDEIISMISKSQNLLGNLRGHQDEARQAMILSGHIRHNFGFSSQSDQLSAMLLRDGLLAQSVESPLHEPIKKQSADEGVNRGSNPRQTTKKSTRR